MASTNNEIPLRTKQPTETDGQRTAENVIKSVLSIHFSQTWSFDTDLSFSSQATGFVVDADRGYIMTNRHVACAGPFRGYAVFDNHEEAIVLPVYRDPVHDFGFLKFDPDAIKHIPIRALTLQPDSAKVGVEIRVVGNDGGEKLSILPGVISRLNRNAPEYPEGYQDFNTNYIQAATSGSGGSSGSPVINPLGHVVGLQAGGRTDKAGTNYFLPLDRPLRALQCLQRGEPITRGTIQTRWVLRPFDECRRLRLSLEREMEIRKAAPKETCMLVCETVLPEGPADGELQEGDILTKVNGEVLTSFIRLDEILDTSVGKRLELLVQRRGQDIHMELLVGDLHAITPDRFVTVAGGSFHDLSYQAATRHVIAVKGVYVSEASGSFKLGISPNGWIIDAIDHKPTPDLKTFTRVVKSIPDRSRVVLSYKHVDNLHSCKTLVVDIDRHWHPKMREASRNDETGLWDFKTVGEPLPALRPTPRSGDFIRLDAAKWSAAADIVRSLVQVSCYIPVKLDGFPHPRTTGFGLVVDAEKGLVVVSRAVVPHNLCDITLTIAGSILVDSEVVFLHPTANYAVVEYEPSLVRAPVQSASLSPENIQEGAETIFVGFNRDSRVVVARTTVTNIITTAAPANPLSPRYRAINLEAVLVDTALSQQCSNGVLIDNDGTVQALWLNYLGPGSKAVEHYYGLATPRLLHVICKIQEGIIPCLRILSIEPQVLLLADAGVMGVSAKWAQEVAKTSPEHHQLFQVWKTDCASKSGPAGPGLLQEGDVILTLNQKLITRISDFDIMYDQEHLDALIVRKGEEVRLKVRTVSTEDLETSRAVTFCGAVFQRPHHAVRQRMSKLPSEIYVSLYEGGSPSYQYGLEPTSFVTAVNGVETPDLDAFVTEVNKIEDNANAVFRIMTLESIPKVITMKKDDHYFPTCEYIKDAVSGWKIVSYN